MINSQIIWSLGLNIKICESNQNIYWINELGQPLQILLQNLSNLLHGAMVNVAHKQPRKVSNHFEGNTLYISG